MRTNPMLHAEPYINYHVSALAETACTYYGEMTYVTNV